MRHTLSLLLLVMTAGSMILPTPASGETPADPNKGTILLTIFLRHDQSKTLDEINAQLQKNVTTTSSRRRVWKSSPGISRWGSARW